MRVVLFIALLASLALVALVSRGFFNRVDQTITGVSATCIDRVVYLQFARGASVAYTTDGKIKTCN